MQTKLTLRLERELIEQAKAFAKRRGKPVSQLVADYFAALPEAPAPSRELPPITRALVGSLPEGAGDIEDHRRRLEEKHR